MSTKDRKRAVAIILKAEPSINQNEIDLEKIKQRTLFDLDDFYRNCLAMPSRAAELKRKALEERAEAKVRDLEVQTREEAEKRTKENGGASDDNGLVPGRQRCPRLPASPPPGRLQWFLIHRRIRRRRSRKSPPPAVEPPRRKN